MALQYILDGYNIIHGVEFSAGRSLEESRAVLLGLIRRRQLAGSSRNQVMVVFDGKNDVWGEPHGGPEKIIFTSGETADDYIKRSVQEAQQPYEIIVVTNDGELGCYVRKLGARLMSVEDFLMKGRGGAKTGGQIADRKKSPDGVKNITHMMERNINAELEDIWINRKKKDV
ncbi:MAG TPA: NYN domain-containing protein [Candidatus Bathyarchaeia archaeon]|nr:NYN domain-containing protein [Candidatus Bathyarchaeia archaeon]